MIKKIIVAVCVFVSAASLAQDNTSSPYSYYGLGETKFKGTHDTRAMGDLNIVGDSIHLNLINPASFSRLKYTTFGVGGTTNFNNLSTNSSEEKAQRTSLDYIAVGLPLGNVGVSFGLAPFSTVGYKVQNVFQNLDGTQRAKSFFGDGSINKVFIGGAYNINKEFSIGLDMSYVFGNVDAEAVEFVTDPSVGIGTRERNNTKTKGILFTAGLMYNKTLKNKLDIYSSFTFRPESRLIMNNTRNIATIVYSGTGGEIVIDDEDFSFDGVEQIIPTKFSLGGGLGVKKKWLVGTELTFTQNSKLKNRFEDIQSSTFENATKISIGGYYIPKYDSFSNYFSRIVYRAGFRYENTGLVINNESINDYGMNFGLGLPVGVSNINLAFEFGKRGTTTNGLIEENYFNVGVGLSLNDIWFKKRKID